jgi:hypothetical protein
MASEEHLDDGDGNDDADFSAVDGVDDDDDDDDDDEAVLADQVSHDDP